MNSTFSNFSPDLLFDVLIEYVPFPIAILDTEMRYLAASRNWVMVYGLVDLDIIGRSHYEILPETPEVWRSVHRQALQGVEHQEGEDPFERLDGTVQWMRWVVEPLKTFDGEVGGIIIFAENITARKADEEALRKSEAYFRALFENTSDYVLLLEAQDSGPPLIVDGNDAAFAKHGYARGEMIGQPITRFETEASAARHSERGAKLLSDGCDHFEVEHICKDGTKFFARVSGKLVKDGSPRARFLVVEQDITALKHAEEMQRKLLEDNRRLAHNLIQVQEDERRALARSLHDNLGQILTSINTTAFRISKKVNIPKIQEMAEHIRENIQTAFDVNHELLLKLRPSTLDALGLEGALVELAMYWQQHAGTTCALHADSKINQLSEVYAITIYRLVQEGMTNAIRHGDARHIDLFINVISGLSGLAMVYLRISDDGKGADQNVLASGLGTIGMRERTQALGGMFTLNASPHGGIEIEAIIPVSEINGRDTRLMQSKL